MTKKVLLQRHRVQIGEGSGPRKERLESQEGLQHHHHPLAPYPGDQREQHHQHSYHREGKEHGGQQGGVEGGSAAVGSAVSRDDCRATAFEVGCRRVRENFSFFRSKRTRKCFFGTPPSFVCTHTPNTQDGPVCLDRRVELHSDCRPFSCN